MHPYSGLRLLAHKGACLGRTPDALLHRALQDSHRVVPTIPLGILGRRLLTRDLTVTVMCVIEMLSVPVSVPVCWWGNKVGEKLCLSFSAVPCSMGIVCITCTMWVVVGGRKD